MHRPFRLAALALASALVLAACGSSGSSSTSSTSATATSAAKPAGSPRPASTVGTSSSSLGTFLVDAKGRALYLWDADHGSKSVCSGASPCQLPRSGMTLVRIVIVVAPVSIVE